MNKQKLPIRELISILIGEAIVSLVICGVYLIISKYTYKVLLGVLLGSTVTVLNFLVLSIMTNRVINRFLEARGDAELTDEEAQAVAMKFQGQVQNQIKISFLVRTAVLSSDQGISSSEVMRRDPVLNINIISSSGD